MCSGRRYRSLGPACDTYKAGSGLRGGLDEHPMDSVIKTGRPSTCLQKTFSAPGLQCQFRHPNATLASIPHAVIPSFPMSLDLIFNHTMSASIMNPRLSIAFLSYGPRKSFSTMVRAYTSPKAHINICTGPGCIESLYQEVESLGILEDKLLK